MKLQDDTLVVATKNQDCVEFEFYEISSHRRIRSLKVSRLDYCQSIFIGDDYFAILHKEKTLITVYAMNTDQKPRDIVLPAISNTISSAPDGNFILVGIMNALYVWHTSSGSLIYNKEICNSYLKAIKFLDNINFITVSDESIITWRLPNLCLGNSSFLCQIKILSSIQALDTIYDHELLTHKLILIYKNSTMCSIYDLITGKLLLSFNLQSPPKLCVFLKHSSLFFLLQNSNFVCAKFKNDNKEIVSLDVLPDPHTSTGSIPASSFNLTVKLCQSYWNNTLILEFPDTIRFLRIKSEANNPALRAAGPSFSYKGTILDLFVSSVHVSEVPNHQVNLMPLAPLYLSGHSDPKDDIILIKPKYVESDVQIPSLYPVYKRIAENHS
ncbi:hypothetical protein RF11_11035 [Thelohanellus kitauei]|uniref:Uncharacterized protein n=1 Tax=Thelohanellus kitauei TaxID=669202 RepID=A0A0C2N630_THEKT|nr:hypothetical protein RF11_11035 [Thelohanellus kitauei]